MKLSLQDILNEVVSDIIESETEGHDLPIVDPAAAQTEAQKFVAQHMAEREAARAAAAAEPEGHDLPIVDPAAVAAEPEGHDLPIVDPAKDPSEAQKFVNQYVADKDKSIYDRAKDVAVDVAGKYQALPQWVQAAIPAALATGVGAYALRKHIRRHR